MKANLVLHEHAVFLNFLPTIPIIYLMTLERKMIENDENANIYFT